MATWLLMGHKMGDNAQLLALIEALNYPYESKRLVYRRTELLTNLLAGPNLHGIVRARSDALAPPWPDLVLTAGRRNEPVARWIRQQAASEGKRARLVHVGRPWSRPENFDLIVTSPQYNLPNAPNVLHNEAPLHRVTAERLAEAASRWAERLAHLPEPRIAVFLGGHAGPYLFDREAGALLGSIVDAMVKAHHGSLLVTTSARTPRETGDAFVASITVPALIHRWRPDGGENPYFGFLACADEAVVSADSMSMLVEVIAAGKPVHIFDLERGPQAHRPPWPSGRSIRPRHLKERVEGLIGRHLWHRVGQALGPAQLRRDLRAIPREQVAKGRATWLGEPDPLMKVPPLNDVARAAARVRALFDLPDA
jgi:mitochondrial fission protein ELM1